MFYRLQMNWVKWVVYRKSYLLITLHIMGFCQVCSSAIISFGTLSWSICQTVNLVSTDILIFHNSFFRGPYAASPWNPEAIQFLTHPSWSNSNGKGILCAKKIFGIVCVSGDVPFKQFLNLLISTFWLSEFITASSSEIGCSSDIWYHWCKRLQYICPNNLCRYVPWSVFSFAAWYLWFQCTAKTMQHFIYQWNGILYQRFGVQICGW